MVFEEVLPRKYSKQELERLRFVCGDCGGDSARNTLQESTIVIDEQELLHNETQRLFDDAQEGSFVRERPPQSSVWVPVTPKHLGNKVETVAVQL